MTKMRAYQVPAAKSPFQMVEKEIPQPGRGQVRIKVHACGVCHSDSLVKEGGPVPVKYPRIPGHEVAGVIDALGAEVTNWSVGQKVGVGWYGGNCKVCESCRRGDVMTCSNMLVTGMSFDGGYAEYMVAPMEAVALLPEGLSFVEAAPLMCAGVTTFNALRNSGAKGGDRVAVLGIGGLGHLAVQFAAKMGFHVIAIARGHDKEVLAKKLGAKQYIDSEAQNPGVELMKMGGVKIILSTATSSKAASDMIGGLSPSGKLIVLGVTTEPLEIPPLYLIGKKLSVTGWPSGSSIDSQDTMRFCTLTGVRSMNEVFPFEKTPDAYDSMMKGKPRFRAVLEMKH